MLFTLYCTEGLPGDEIRSGPLDAVRIRRALGVARMPLQHRDHLLRGRDVEVGDLGLVRRVDGPELVGQVLGAFVEE